MHRVPNARVMSYPQTEIRCDDDDALKFKLITGAGRKYGLSTPAISQHAGMDDNGLAREQWIQAIYGVVKIHCEALGVNPAGEGDALKVLDDAKKLREQIDHDIELGLVRRRRRRRRRHRRRCCHLLQITAKLSPPLPFHVACACRLVCVRIYATSNVLWHSSHTQSDGGKFTGMKGRAVWKNPKDWGPWCQFVFARYFIMALGLVAFVATIWVDHSPTSALIMVVIFGCALFGYDRKIKKKKKKWMKKRGAVGQQKAKGLKGLAKKYQPGKTSSGGGSSHLDDGFKQKVAMAKMAGKLPGGAGAVKNMF